MAVAVPGLSAPLSAGARRSPSGVGAPGCLRGSRRGPVVLGWILLKSNARGSWGFGRGRCGRTPGSWAVFVARIRVDLYAEGSELLKKCTCVLKVVLDVPPPRTPSARGGTLFVI